MTLNRVLMSIEKPAKIIIEKPAKNQPKILHNHGPISRENVSLEITSSLDDIARVMIV